MMRKYWMRKEWSDEIKAEIFNPSHFHIEDPKHSLHTWIHHNLNPNGMEILWRLDQNSQAWRYDLNNWIDLCLYDMQVLEYSKIGRLGQCYKLKDTTEEQHNQYKQKLLDLSIMVKNIWSKRKSIIIEGSVLSYINEVTQSRL